MQHLDRRFEHFDEFEHALGGPVETAAVGVGIGVVLTEKLELANIDLADERGDVLIVLVARLGLSNADLPKFRRINPYDTELRNVATVFIQSFDSPRRHQSGQPAARDGIAIFEDQAHGVGIEQSEWTFEHRADLLAGTKHVDWAFLHERLQTVRQGGFSSTHGAEQVEDLLPLLESLCGMAEETDDSLDRFLHTEEIFEGRINLDRSVEENPAQPFILGRVDKPRLANRLDHSLGRARVMQRIFAASFQKFLERHFRMLVNVITLRIDREDVVYSVHYLVHGLPFSPSPKLHKTPLHLRHTPCRRFTPLPPRANIRRAVGPGSAYFKKAPRTVLSLALPLLGAPLSRRALCGLTTCSATSISQTTHRTASAPSPSAPSARDALQPSCHEHEYD